MLARVIDEIDVTGFPMPIKLSAILDAQRGREVLVVELSTRERDTGEPMVQRFEWELPHYKNAVAAGWILRFVVDRCTDAITHELREHFKHKGERVIDPHSRIGR